jgi:hypothetical protein
MKPVGLMDIKQALHDERFRSLFPELEREIDQTLRKPNCGSCGVPLARKILNDYPDRVGGYFPGRPVLRPEDEAKQLADNHWTVINCHVNDLEAKLKQLPPGRKQLAVTRHGDQVTCVVNELMVVF